MPHLSKWNHGETIISQVSLSEAIIGRELCRIFLAISFPPRLSRASTCWQRIETQFNSTRLSLLSSGVPIIGLGITRQKISAQMCFAKKCSEKTSKTMKRKTNERRWWRDVCGISEKVSSRDEATLTECLLMIMNFWTHFLRRSRLERLKRSLAPRTRGLLDVKLRNHGNCRKFHCREIGTKFNRSLEIITRTMMQASREMVKWLMD